MKNPLVIALLILAVLGGAIWYTRENPPAEGDEETVPMVSVEEGQIAQVSVLRPGQEPLTVTRAEGENEWRFADHEFAVDQSAVGLMITNLSSLDAERVVNEETTDWAPYGLDGDGELAVDVQFRDLEDQTKPDAAKIVFGRSTPTGSGVYARLEGDPRLFTTFSYVRTTFEKDIFDWRDKDLIQVDSDTISRIRLDLGDRRYEFGKSGADWQILEPRPLRGDDFTIGDLARSLENAEMTEVVVEGEGEEPAVDFSQPLATAEVVDSAGAHTITVVDEGDRFLARSSDQPGVYQVSAAFAQGLDKPLEEFRDKKLFDFGFEPIRSLEIQRDGSSIRIEKRDADWLLTSEGDRKLDAAAVQGLIDSLRNLEAVDFPADEPGQLGRFGLSSPTIIAKVTPEGEGAATDEVLLSDPDADAVYAARAGEPSIYAVEQAAAEAVERAVDEAVAAEATEESETPEEQ